MPLIHTLRVPLLALMLGLITASAPVSAATGSNEEVLHIDFPGGTVAEFIALIRTLDPEANIILMPDAGDVKLPSIDIRSPRGPWTASYPSYLSVIHMTTHATSGPTIEIESDGRHHLVRLASEWIGHDYHDDGGIGVLETPVISYSLGHVIVPDDLSADDVLATIENVLEMADQQETPPILRFHEPTRMLITRATWVQHNSIERTINELQKSADEIRAERTTRSMHEQNHRMKQMESALKEEIAKRDTIIEQLSRELEEAMRRLNDLPEQPD